MIFLDVSYDYGEYDNLVSRAARVDPSRETWGWVTGNGAPPRRTVMFGFERTDAAENARGRIKRSVARSLKIKVKLIRGGS